MGEASKRPESRADVYEWIIKAMSFRERAFFSIPPLLIALLGTYQYNAAPTRMDIRMPGAQAILAKPVLSSSTSLTSSKARISFHDPQSGRPLGWHIYCSPYPEACKKLLAHQDAPLEITLVPEKQRYLVSNSTEAWLLRAQADGKTLVSDDEQARIYTENRRGDRMMLVICYLIFLGAIAYATRGSD